MAEELLTPSEVADILKIKKNTVYEMIKRGDINATKMGKQLRISKSDLSVYLNKSNITSTPSLPKTLPAMEFKPSTTDSQFVICGQDIILDRICDLANQTSHSNQVLRSHMGSYNGLYALYNEQFHIATAHLWDGSTNSYNLTYISKVLPGFLCAVYHLLNRKQGFYMKKGNPKNIQGFKDMNRTDITFVNREKGCGTRILLDNKLIDHHILPSQVVGYETIVTSHLASATMVAKGEADYALGNERSSLQFPEIAFIPLQTESYDMVIPLKYLNHPITQLIINIINSVDFQKEIELMGGYDVKDMGKRLL